MASAIFVRTWLSRGAWHWVLLLVLFCLASIRGAARFEKRTVNKSVETYKAVRQEVRSVLQSLTEEFFNLIT
jgi:protein-S-isoprenylcysteine O-methyltransferase Ste14